MSKRPNPKKSKHSNSPDLVTCWKSYKSRWAKLVTEPAAQDVLQQAQSSTRLLHQRIGALGVRQQLDQAIASAQVTADNRRVLTLDVLDALSGQIQDINGQPTVYLLWGMAVTAEIGQLLQLHRQCDELGAAMDALTGQNSSLVVGLIPDHMACALSPQALWSVGASLIGGCWGDERSDPQSPQSNQADRAQKLTQLRTAMEGYFVPHHCNLDADLHAVGSAIMMIATRHTGEHPLMEEVFQGQVPASAVDQWRHALDVIKSRNQWNLMASLPCKWSQSTVEAVVQHIDSQWILEVRHSNPEFSLLNVDEVELIADDQHLWARAFAEEKLQAACKIPTASLLWCLPLVMEQWKRRGIVVRGYDKIKTRG